MVLKDMDIYIAEMQARHEATDVVPGEDRLRSEDAEPPPALPATPPAPGGDGRPTDMEAFNAELDRRREIAGGTQQEADAQHRKSRLTARERLAELFDPGTFTEIDTLVLPRYESYYGKCSRYGDGVVTGFGQIDGRYVCAAAQDAAVMGGSLGEMHAAKIVKVMKLALRYLCPFVALNDSGGARIQEGVDSLAGYARLFDTNCEASGVIPQISAILGPCAGGAVYSPGLTDFVFMTEHSYMFITGPDVLRTVMREQITQEELGGGDVHARQSGVCHVLASDDHDCMRRIRVLLGYLPSNNRQDPPYMRPGDDPERLCPEVEQVVPINPRKPYDVRDVIGSIVDGGQFFEIHEQWARNIVVGFARLNGHAVGIVANQPAELAGCIDIDASVKAAHFIRTCDAFNVPIVTLQDVPGFLPGKDQEHGGIIRNGARLIYAYSEATVPKLMVILRKSYGGAYCVMSSRGLRGDLLYAWPNAEIAVMGAEGAVNLLHRGELAGAADPCTRRAQLVAEYELKFSNPYVAAARGLIDDVIAPRDTRRVLIKALEFSLSKQERHEKKKHGVAPM